MDVQYAARMQDTIFKLIRIITITITVSILWTTMYIKKSIMQDFFHKLSRSYNNGYKLTVKNVSETIESILWMWHSFTTFYVFNIIIFKYIEIIFNNLTFVSQYI